MLRSRRLRLALVLVPLLAACGGPSTRLVTVRAGNGGDEVVLELQNASDTPVNSVFMAKTEAVRAAGPGHAEGETAQAVWGGDLVTGSAIGTGERRRIPVAGPGRWDLRAIDRDDREQHIIGLKLDGGGRYILELQDGGWRSR